MPPCRAPAIVSLIASQQPDAVLVSPLVKQQFHQGEVVKAARSLGVPTGFLVYSWDNLSNKGRVHVPPDRTFVWNDLQRREATELHGLDPASIVVTGAPHWDAFFRMQPSLTREELCAAHGFDPERPIVLYLGSTTAVCPDEPRGRRRLAGRRPSGAAARRRQRARPPPPRRQGRLGALGPSAERVSLSRHPRQQDQSLYDELHHCAAVVGLNTSAQIEASILGRPVYTFAAGELAPGQAGSLHFRYLLREHGGVVDLRGDARGARPAPGAGGRGRLRPRRDPTVQRGVRAAAGPRPAGRADPRAEGASSPEARRALRLPN